MLSAFPSLLSWSQLSPLLIRVTLGAVFVFRSYRALAKTSNTSMIKLHGLIEGLAGILLIIGLWTQVAALVAAIDMIALLIERGMKKALFTDGVNYYLILLVMALSLLVTGAGFLAFDLPL